MNVFNKILQNEAVAATSLGNPSADYAAHRRRMNAMATMTGTRGFSVPPMEPRKDAQGFTRGDRKRAIRAATADKVSEYRAPEFRHSSAKGAA